MRPTEKSFNQVKAILGKLDRNIDQLRATRATPAPVAAGPAASGLGLHTTIGGGSTNGSQAPAPRPDPLSTTLGGPGPSKAPELPRSSAPGANATPAASNGNPQPTRPPSTFGRATPIRPN